MGIHKVKEMLKSRLQREKLYCTEAYWDFKASVFDGDAVSMWPNNNLNRHYHLEQIDLVERLMPPLTGLSVLDVGCGTGRNSRYLAARGASVTGIDFSGKSIGIARTLTSGDNPFYRRQSVFELEEQGAFDALLSWGTLTVACRDREELLAALMRLRRALKPNGFAVICEPIHRGPLHRVLNMSLRGFLTAMEEAGFRILRTTQMHFWPMRLLLAFLPWPKPVTALGFHLGKGIMACFGNRAFGDYKVICARPK